MAKSGLPATRACLFDMDGLLIDSEDLYTICTNEVLHEYGRPDLPWNIKAQLQGRPGPEVCISIDSFPSSSTLFHVCTRKRMEDSYF